ncbi:chaperonin 10-like protein [Mycena rosella]|uniref:Chaperonin 10-like protein n=1 Tax=Mycena rosella TaxID=1033263 RepID=A0AAD7H1Y8_MYCRO|nr:chaperonin 10-like protein [Mycena rosella]
MAPIKNARVLFNSIPKDYPVPGESTVYDTTETIDLDNHPLNGGFLVKTLVLSVDPYMRGRMKGSDVKSYIPGFVLGKPITGFGVGVVLRSENEDVPVGKHVYGIGFLHQEYFVLSNMSGFIFLEGKPGLPWSVYTGAAGMPGQTAYAGWKEYAYAKPGETALVIQLAKRDGLKVIASAGSDEKVKFMRDIGADIAFNYKTTDTAEVLAREGPIDIYWDNVGGDVLDAALLHAAVYARFLVRYNTGHQGIKNLHQVYAMSLTMSGVSILRLAKYNEEFYANVPRALAAGEFKYSEDVSHGLDKVGDVLLAVQTGANTGKAVVVVAEE